MLWININVRWNGTILPPPIRISNPQNGILTEGKFKFYFRCVAIHRCFLSVSSHHGRRRHSTAPRTPSRIPTHSNHPQSTYLLTSPFNRTVSQFEMYHGISLWKNTRVQTRFLTVIFLVKPSGDLSRRCWSCIANVPFQLALNYQTIYTY